MTAHTLSRTQRELLSNAEDLVLHAEQYRLGHAADGHYHQLVGRAHRLLDLMPAVAR